MNTGDGHRPDDAHDHGHESPHGLEGSGGLDLPAAQPRRRGLVGFGGWPPLPADLSNVPMHPCHGTASRSNGNVATITGDKTALVHVGKKHVWMTNTYSVVIPDPATGEITIHQ